MSAQNREHYAKYVTSDGCSLVIIGTNVGRYLVVLSGDFLKRAFENTYLAFLGVNETQLRSEIIDVIRDQEECLIYEVGALRSNELSVIYVTDLSISEKRPESSLFFSRKDPPLSEYAKDCVLYCINEVNNTLLSKRRGGEKTNLFITVLEDLCDRLFT